MRVRAVIDREGMFEKQAAAPRRLRYPVMLEMAILCALAIVLAIALAMISSLVSERFERSKAARAEIAAGWGEAQTIGGPMLIVPYRVHTDDKKIVEYHARFLPTQLRIKGSVAPERRHRGIFQSVLYRSDLHVEGQFERPDFSAWKVAPEDIEWGDAVMAVGISDLRGIRGNPVLKWDGQQLPFSGGSADASLFPGGVHVAIPFAPAPLAGERHSFSFDLRLNGSESISFLPFGGETVVELSSPWPDPSFSGAFLPDARTVTPQGFTARWNISSIGRNFPQQWRDSGDEHKNAVTTIGASAFGAGLFSPVGHYQKTERSVKYGVLFIILTFLTFFLYELLSPVTLHPVQYFLVGGALCLFYLLLLSISEQASFDIAYAVASIATVGLISAYGAALLRNRLRVLGLCGVMSLLYGYLYVLLQLEDWALLMGSIGLFAILALVMYATRNVDWGSAHVAQSE